MLACAVEVGEAFGGRKDVLTVLVRVISGLAVDVADLTEVGVDVMVTAAVLPDKSSGVNAAVLRVDRVESGTLVD